MARVLCIYDNTRHSGHCGPCRRIRRRFFTWFAPRARGRCHRGPHHGDQPGFFCVVYSTGPHHGDQPGSIYRPPIQATFFCVVCSTDPAWWVHITETSPVLFIGRRFRRRFFTWFAPRVHITETIPDFFTWFTPRCATRGAHSPPACLDRDVHDGDAVPYLARGSPSARPSPE